MINVTFQVREPVLFRNPLFPCVSKLFAFVVAK